MFFIAGSLYPARVWISREHNRRLPRSFAEPVFANRFSGDIELTDMKKRGGK
jgi:hypothetical protein